MNKDITLEEYTIKINAILAEKGKEFTQEELTPLWKSLQNGDMDITFDDEIYEYEEAKNNHLLKYRGAFTGGANAEEEYNQYRINKYGGTGEEFNIIDYAGIGKAKVNIPDDIKIKDIKLNDKQYLEERFGIKGEEDKKK